MNGVFHVELDGHAIQHGLSYRKAWEFASMMQTNSDTHIAGTSTRTGEFAVKRCTCVTNEEDALYKQFRRRTVVSRP